MAGEATRVEEDGLKRSQVAGVQRSRIIAATFAACAEKGNLVAAMSMTALGDFEGLPTERELENFRAGHDEVER